VIPPVFTSHVGYLPQARKIAVCTPECASHGSFRLFDCRVPGPTEYQGPLVPVDSDWGPFCVADFSDFTRTGCFQISVNDYALRSIPFMIAEDVYVKTARLAFGYFHTQHCGAAVPGFHGPCHLDDAVRRDNGVPVDVTGGWHDAGDLRKWMGSSLAIVAAMVEINERLAPGWHAFSGSEGDLLAEARWENDYFLKMQDPASGLVWHDTAGGVAGDNSDNRFTDNVPGSGDERHVNTAIAPSMQWGFIECQMALARAYAEFDPDYAARCRRAGERCLEAHGMAPEDKALNAACAVTALIAAHRLRDERALLVAAHAQAARLLECQEREWTDDQQELRGWFCTDATRTAFIKGWRATAQPVIALCALTAYDPDNPAVARYRAAVTCWLDDYIFPLAVRSPFGIVPFGLYRRPPVGGAVLRPLAGGLGYRWFTGREAASRETAAQEQETFEHGGTSHLLNHALAFALVARLLSRADAEQLAWRQIEWVMGANPLGMCLMTGGGVNTPWPYSPQVGLIPGGIVNGFVGGPDDVPVVHTGADQWQWGSTEYWGPHNGYYLHALAVLLEGRDILW
jgi:hypothetical protein